MRVTYKLRRSVSIHKVATEREDWVKVSALEGVPLCGNKASSTRLEGKIMISKPLLWKL